MRTGTTVGLLVGGAVLLLAVSKPHAATAAASPYYPPGSVPATGAAGGGYYNPNNYPGGALNPLNWFGNPLAQQPASYMQPQNNNLLANPFGAQSPMQQPGGYQYANYNSPNYGGGYSPAASPMAGEYGPGITTPPTAGQSPAYYNAAYTTPPSAGGGSPQYQQAAYSPSSPASTPAGGSMAYWA